MTFTEAAAEVLRLAGKPLHYKEITELAIEKNLLSHVGKSPEVTMGARLAAMLKKDDKTNPIVRVKPGVFALREWEGKKKGKKAAAEDVAVDEDAPASGEGEINALEVEAVAAPAPPPPPSSPAFGASSNQSRTSASFLSDDDDDDDEGGVSEVTGEDALRADLAAKGAELFDDEDDDDQPIFASTSNQPAVPGAAVGEGPDGGRRRRRRRRRGRGGGTGDLAPREGVPGASPSSPNGSTFGYEVMDAPPVDPNLQRDPLAPAPRPQIRERHQIMAGGAPSGIDVPLGEGEELSGRELADATLIVMTAFDRNGGPIPVRSLTDALMRRGRLAGDPQAACSQLSASLRADNLRRVAQSQRPRFRFAGGGRVAPTEWGLGSDLLRLEADVAAAVDRYREASRRLLLRRLQELPGHAFVEIALIALERAGLTQIKSVRRAGSPGGEVHFAGIHRTGSDEIRTGVVLRKDGREIGRERVSDLRGALHHYGPATVGWLITTGQVLSGAREEAAAPLAPPVALYDGLSLCKLMEDSDVGVIRTKFAIAIPDLELFENVRG